MADDVTYMARAIRLARRGLYTARPNPVVGCVVVKDGVVVGEGFHRKAGEAHAEVHALAAAGDAAAGATIYVTLEPCCHVGKTPPCADALIAARVKRVVVAMQDPNPAVSGRGIEQLRAAGIEVNVGLLQAQAARLNRGFVKRMRQGMPYVRVKSAISLDGRTAMASGESRWISDEYARADVHRLRASSGALLTSSNTVLMDDPALTYRPDDFAQLDQEMPPDIPQPMRVICDSNLRIPADASILRQPGDVLIATLRQSERATALQEAGAEVIQVQDGGDGKISLRHVLAILAERGVNDVMVEAGAVLAGAFLSAKLVDEFVIYVAPHLMGDAARGLVSLPGVTGMAQRAAVDIKDIRAVGDNWRIIAAPVYS